MSCSRGCTSAASPQDQDVFRSLGRVSETATMRTMARRLDGSDQALAELKVVDGPIRLQAAATLQGGGSFADALQATSAVADGMLLDRLALKVGDKMRIGKRERS